MKIKTSELSGATLDWAVAKCEGMETWPKYPAAMWANYSPVTDWAQGGPIIEREQIAILSPMTGDFWDARDGKRMETPFIYWRGPTPLIAAMRCYVASKLGDTVDVPDELA